MILRILHLSDLHFRALEKDPVKSFNADVVTTSMLQAIENLVNEGALIDLVIITGDIAFSGKKAEYDVADEFFDRLRKITGLPNARFFIVPGNHDVDRDMVTKWYIKTWYAFNTQDDITAALTDKNLFPILIQKFTEYNIFANIILAGPLRSGTLRSRNTLRPGPGGLGKQGSG
jgi:DNA repair exonuclease SbcCD nuclease subunit